MSVWIMDLVTVKYVIAQQQPDSISLSLILSYAITLHNVPIAPFIDLCLGIFCPECLRQRLLNAQQNIYILYFAEVLLIKSIKIVAPFI